MNEDIKNDVDLIMQEVYTEPVFQLHHFPDADVLIRFKPDATPADETATNIPPSSPPASLAYTFLALALAMLLPAVCILFQVYALFNPLTASVSILVASQGLALPGQRQLHPITLVQTQTGPATGSGHEAAKTATGTVTFYNGLFTAQTIPAGTVFTGSDGIQVMTNADVSIPAASPPVFAIASVFAHALNPGIAGNIPAGDIDTSIANGVLVKNLGAFYGGKNARSYHVVTRDDINSLATAVQARLLTTASSLFGKQLQQGEDLTTPQCVSSTASSHPAGQEASQVQVTVKDKCMKAKRPYCWGKP